MLVFGSSWQRFSQLLECGLPCKSAIMRLDADDNERICTIEGPLNLGNSYKLPISEMLALVIFKRNEGKSNICNDVKMFAFCCYEVVIELSSLRQVPHFP